MMMMIMILLFVKPACGEQDIVVTTTVHCMCVVHASVWICPGHYLYICAWNSN